MLPTLSQGVVLHLTPLIASTVLQISTPPSGLIWVLIGSVFIALGFIVGYEVRRGDLYDSDHDSFDGCQKEGKDDLEKGEAEADDKETAAAARARAAVIPLFSARDPRGSATAGDNNNGNAFYRWLRIQWARTGGSGSAAAAAVNPHVGGPFSRHVAPRVSAGTCTSPLTAPLVLHDSDTASHERSETAGCVKAMGAAVVDRGTSVDEATRMTWHYPVVAGLDPVHPGFLVPPTSGTERAA
jgi:hypothetical protein